MIIDHHGVFGGATVPNKLLVAGALASCWISVSGTPALAEPDQCAASGTVYLCTGDQHQGIVVGTNSGTATTATEVTVKDLTPLSGNAPYASPFVWDLPSSTGEIREFNLDLGSVEMKVDEPALAFWSTGYRDLEAGADMKLTWTGVAVHSGELAALLETQSIGYNSYNGADSNANGAAGHPGGAGGPVSIQLNYGVAGKSSLTGTDASSIGISGYAAGGKGGYGGHGGAFYDGGSGGNGGTTGPLYLGNAGPATISAGAGVMLQSIAGNAGKGGNGGNRGGAGGTGGTAGPIYLDHDGSSPTTGAWDITTTADNSYGFSLQSVGGHGGDGGGTTNSDSESAGGGGHGGTIVAASGVSRKITTKGDGSFAFYALSQGGDGGSGGGTEGAGGAGSAGAAGSGGSVEIAGAWQVEVSGQNAFGLWLQSQGGVGGNGGSGNTGNLKAARAGAAGGDSGPIELRFTGADSTVTMQAADGLGVFARSQGGEGGSAGQKGRPDGNNLANAVPGGNGGTASGSIYATTDVTTTITSTQRGLKLESRGGAGGKGNTDPSEGYAGPGGTGGQSADIEFNLSKSGALSTGVWDISTSQQGGSALIFEATGGAGGPAGDSDQTAGGKGGDGGDGGAIGIHTGIHGLTTTGASSTALLATSTGGIGSTGGTRTPNSTLKVQGLDGGNGGDGGPLSLDGEWVVKGKGASSAGMTLASTGAAGGKGGVSYNGDHNGGSGGAGGKGGDITLYAGVSGQLNTTARGASFSSLGGNGGDGADQSDNDLVPGTGGDGGRGGDGGALTVVGQWFVETSEDNAAGLTATSTGGNGGLKATGGSDGKGGVGGKVSVDVTANGGLHVVKTTGAGADGLVAVSRSGSEAPSTTSSTPSVVVNAGGDVTTTGASSHAIYAESSGNTRGAIDVTVASGVTVTGGAAASTPNWPDGGGVYVVDGTANLLTNNGRVGSVPGATGVAVEYVGDGMLDILNNGTLTGRVINATVEAARQDAPGGRATTGRINLVNGTEGIIYAGPDLQTARLTNHGRISIWGDGATGDTILGGDLTQAAGGLLNFEIDWDYRDKASLFDTLAVDGLVDLQSGSSIVVSLLSDLPPGYTGTHNILLADAIGLDALGIADHLVFPNVDGVRFGAQIARQDNRDVVQVAIAPVPLPATAVLLLSALGLSAFLRHRRLLVARRLSNDCMAA